MKIPNYAVTATLFSTVVAISQPEPEPESEYPGALSCYPFSGWTFISHYMKFGNTILDIVSIPLSYFLCTRRGTAESIQNSCPLKPTRKATACSRLQHNASLILGGRGVISQYLHTNS